MMSGSKRKKYRKHRGKKPQLRNGEPDPWYWIPHTIHGRIRREIIVYYHLNRAEICRGELPWPPKWAEPWIKSKWHPGLRAREGAEESPEE